MASDRDARFTAAEILRRRPVWGALSELFLDAELQPVAVARALSGSGFSEEELERILWEEVAPVLAGNLQSPAGQWAGFDEDWLVEQIVAGCAAARRLPRLWRLRREVAADWRRVAAALLSEPC